VDKVVIYTKTGCPYCQRLMQDYRARGVSFQEVNITVDASIQQMVKEKFGAEKVPIIVEDGKLISIGYNGGG